MNKCYIRFFLVLALFFINAGIATAAIIVVPDVNSSTIQAAITNASNGDTILVSAGTYTENVNVTKELTIISASGNPDNTIVQASDTSDYIFNVTADNVTINGFNITGATTSYGIYCYGVQHGNISDNIFSGNDHGIYLESSSNNTISNNNANLNVHSGIYLYSNSNHNTVSSNTATFDEFGFYIYGSSNNTLTDNNASSNTKSGFILYVISNYNTLSNNIANSNHESGVYLTTSCSNNTLSNNTLNSNNYGTYVYNNCNDTTFSSNTASNNSNTGIRLRDSVNTTIYNNYFNNTINATFFGTTTGTVWNITKTAGTNIIGGPYLGGNFWAKPDGTGFSETCNDTDVDGISDSSFTIETGHIDYLPLTNVPGITSTTPSASTVSTYEGTAQTFTVEISQTVNVTWYINGTSVQTDTSVTSASYTNSTAANGTYNITAFAANVNGTDSQTWNWTVLYLAETVSPTPNDDGLPAYWLLKRNQQDTTTAESEDAVEEDGPEEDTPTSDIEEEVPTPTVEVEVPTPTVEEEATPTEVEDASGFTAIFAIAVIGLALILKRRKD
ncbi:MAG: right-handed parallel beta-helix repeat-containing protein [Methanosarcinaceae archaeon]|nr:right-handed parallel beta-helix repeat-containing protein [Methanosarcinaceae archaeon]